MSFFDFVLHIWGDLLMGITNYIHCWLFTILPDCPGAEE